MIILLITALRKKLKDYPLTCQILGSAKSKDGGARARRFGYPRLCSCFSVTHRTRSATHIVTIFNERYHARGVVFIERTTGTTGTTESEKSHIDSTKREPPDPWISSVCPLRVCLSKERVALALLTLPPPQKSMKFVR